MKKPPHYHPLKPGSSAHYRYLAGRAYIKNNKKEFDRLEALAVKALIAEQQGHREKPTGSLPGIARL